MNRNQVEIHAFALEIHDAIDKRINKIDLETEITLLYLEELEAPQNVIDNVHLERDKSLLEIKEVQKLFDVFCRINSDLHPAGF